MAYGVKSKLQLGDLHQAGEVEALRWIRQVINWQINELTQRGDRFLIASQAGQTCVCVHHWLLALEHGHVG